MNSDADKTQAIHKEQNHTHSCCGDCCSSHTSNLEGEYAHSLESLRINNKEITFLRELVKCNYLPVSRFIMSSSIEEEARIVSLAPVYINSIDDSMEMVKEIRTILAELEKKGLISLDYDIPLQDYDYTQYTKSALFLYFQETVNEGKRNPSYLFDTAEIELGSIALTDFGEKVSENIESYTY
ncbi:MAG: Abi-alpha family protein [Syntrophomonas sp.]